MLLLVYEYFNSSWFQYLFIGIIALFYSLPLAVLTAVAVAIRAVVKSRRVE